MQAREAGFDGFLRKPVTGAVLAKALAGLMPA
jgi:CheY-like chemotaxis protein